ncbi:glycosyltransferase family 4 protein [Aurantiacibacter sp. D1-12]|uniref:glycosyltransferase family 4 protein n=1 Tax=Aurantiacibacter sp. D1-12 TaxID=2993658 RepID=UPI00237D042B|nr:glycosyltransferase family 4 protein [Aurantiacibacter sp. D1-12]MDE1468266.1 glycosyltransferase family 4 protein [Aurantiacibacter sp. D1-12]
MNKPRLWVVSELYYPEETSTGYFVTHIAQGLADRFEVKALCSRPTYSERDMNVPARETHAGVEIRRAWSTRFDKDGLVGRLLNLLTLTFSISIRALFSFGKGDRVLVLTNPPTLPPIVGFIARLKGARPFLLVHDVYPEVLVATGFIKSGGVVDRLLGTFIGSTYRLYEKIVVLGRDMAKVAERRVGNEHDRVMVIPNWGDVDEIRPIEADQNPFSAKHNPEQRAIIQFSGNIGRTHDVEAILEAARSLGDRDDIAVQFVGFGGKASLVSAAEKPGIPLLQLPRQPRDMLPGMLSGADAVVIAFVDNMLGVSVPSRMYNVMAAGTPIIAMAHPESELALVVKEEECGWVLPPGDADGLARIMEHIVSAEGRAEAAQRGLRGRKAVIRSYSLPAILADFRHLLD